MVALATNEPKDMQVKNHIRRQLSDIGMNGVEEANNDMAKINLNEADCNEPELDLSDVFDVLSCPRPAGSTAFSDSRSDRSANGSSLTGNGSCFLRAMSESFNGAYDASFSSQDGSDSQTEEQAQEQTPSSSTPEASAPGRGRGRKLPQRTGSGYVRGAHSRNGHTESPKIRRSLRSSIIKGNPINGMAVSAAALKEKRMSASAQRLNYNHSQAELRQNSH